MYTIIHVSHDVCGGRDRQGKNSKLFSYTFLEQYMFQIRSYIKISYMVPLCSNEQL